MVGGNETWNMKVPYAALGYEEGQGLLNYIRDFSSGDIEVMDLFWQQTAEEGRGVVEVARKAEFVVSGEILFEDGFGDSRVACYVYPSGFKERDIDGRFYADYAIGRIALWERWGFVNNPVCIWYRPKTLEHSVRLREVYKKKSILFSDAVNLDDLRSEIAVPGTRAETLRGLLEKLEARDLK